MAFFRDITRAVLRGEITDWIAKVVGRRSGTAARTYRAHFFRGLALVVGGLVLAGLFLQGLQGDVKGQSVDLAIRSRLHSPAPDDRVVILDIDERSLALMAPNFGRWPWPRSILAEAIANLEEIGVAGIAVNVMMSDPDKGNQDADAIFNEIAQTASRTVFPMVRLDRRNDVESQVRVGQIPGVQLDSEEAGARKIALLFPFAPGTHDKLGINNLSPDKDGVVRKYRAYWTEEGFRLPSLAMRSLNASEVTPPLGEKVMREGIILNWRNKNGSYRRISFADVYSAMNGQNTFNLESFKGKYVILGVSAPGIAVLKGTAASTETDDNYIAATALDDLLNDTHLRVMPAWASALVSLVFLAMMAAAFERGISDKLINRTFVLAQSSMVAVTIGSASYSHYLIDLSSCFFVVFCYFVIATLYLKIHRNAMRGMPAFADLPTYENRAFFSVIGTKNRPDQAAATRLCVALERSFGIRQTVFIDNAFGDGNFFGRVSKNLAFFIVFSPDEHGELAKRLTNQSGIDAIVGSFELPPNLKGEELEAAIGEKILEVSTRILQYKRSSV